MLHNIRTLRGYTLKYVANKFAEITGDIISEQTISAWERGTRRIYADQLYTLSLIYGCSMETLMNKPCDRTGSRVVDEINSLPPHEKDIIMYIATEWDGDVHALINSVAEYVSLKPQSRIIGSSIIHNDLFIKEPHEIELPIDTEYLEKAFKILDKK